MSYHALLCLFRQAVSLHNSRAVVKPLKKIHADHDEVRATANKLDTLHLVRCLAFHKGHLAVCPQSNLLATILSKEPLITESITLDAWTDKDSSLLTRSIQSVLLNHQHRRPNNRPVTAPYGSPVGAMHGSRKDKCTYLNTGVPGRICSTSSISASAGAVVALPWLGDANGGWITLLGIVPWSRERFALKTGIRCTLIKWSSKSEGGDKDKWEC